LYRSQRIANDSINQRKDNAVKRKHRKILSVLFITTFCVLGLYVARDTVFGVIERTLVYDTYADWELAKLRERFAKGSLTEIEARVRLMEVTRQNPGTQAEVGAFAFVATRWPESAEAKEALAKLPSAIEGMPVGDLASCLDRTKFGNGGFWRPFGIALIARVEQEPAHPRAGRLLATAARVLRPSDDDAEPSDEMIQVCRNDQGAICDQPRSCEFL
jgi:hypothetical protein